MLTDADGVVFFVLQEAPCNNPDGSLVVIISNKVKKKIVTGVFGPKVEKLLRPGDIYHFSWLKEPFTYKDKILPKIMENK